MAFPSDVTSIQKKANELYNNNDMNGLISYCQTLRGQYPDWPFPHIQIGIALDELGDKIGAKSSFAEAVRCFKAFKGFLPPPFKATLEGRGYGDLA